MAVTANNHSAKSPLAEDWAQIDIGVKYHYKIPLITTQSALTSVSITRLSIGLKYNISADLISLGCNFNAEIVDSSQSVPVPGVGW